MDTSELIRTRYGAFAATSGQQESCCAASSGDGGYAIEQGLYTDDELAGVPDSARALSRGCGNPTGFAELQTGEVVVDLGCGGGIDLVLAAAKVGPAGRVIGVDFTAQMIEQATLKRWPRQA
jgi:arsenite methyltransferase